MPYANDKGSRHRRDPFELSGPAKVAPCIVEFGAKPALKGKRAEDLTDMSLVGELEKERFFERPADNPAMHGDRAE